MGNTNLAQARERALRSPRIGKRGRGKKTLERERARELLWTYFAEEFEPIVRKQIEMAKDGDSRAAKDLMDRLFGRPTVHMEVTGNGSDEIEKLRLELKEFIKR